MKSSYPKNRQPIGVFDSGLGGLTVVREIRQRLPHEDIIYFGDIARLPYGIKSKEQILKFSFENARFLLKKKVKAIVVACNSSASASYGQLKEKLPIPVVDVILPAAAEAFQITKTGRIGLIATQATIASQAYEKALGRFGKIKVFSKACPLFVPIVEEGWLAGPITRQIAKKYLQPLAAHKMDTLILGCTHYPMLHSVIQQTVGRKVRLIDSAGPTVDKLASLLIKNGLSYPAKRKGKLAVYVSDLPRNFRRIGERFLGEKLNQIKVVRAG